MSAPHPSRRRVLFGTLGTAGAAVLSAPASPAGGAPDRALIGLCARFDQLERRIQAMGERGPFWIEDDDTRELAAEPLKERQGLLLDRICTMRVTSLPGLQARAGSLALWLGDQVGETGSGYWHHRMLAALLRDATGAA